MSDWETLLLIEDSLKDLQDVSLILANIEAIVDNNQLNLTAVKEDSQESLATDTYSDLEHILVAPLVNDFITCPQCHCLVSGSMADCCVNYLTNLSILSSNESSYWIHLINNPTGCIMTLPTYTKLLFQSGINPLLRPTVWEKLLTVESEDYLQLFNNFDIPSSFNSQISKDLHRTFPSIPFFKQQETVVYLSKILNIYANYDVEIGYCQGLLFLVGPLYYILRCPSTTFIALVQILDMGLRDNYNETMSGFFDWFGQFNSIFEKFAPELKAHFDDLGIDTTIFLSQWFISVMAINCPFQFLLRLFDLMILEGFQNIIFKTALLILSKNQQTLLEFDNDEMIYDFLLNKKHDVWENDTDKFISDLDSIKNECLTGFNKKTDGVPKERIIDKLNLFKWSQVKKDDKTLKLSYNETADELNGSDETKKNIALANFYQAEYDLSCVLEERKSWDSSKDDVIIAKIEEHKKRYEQTCNELSKFGDDVLSNAQQARRNGEQCLNKNYYAKDIPPTRKLALSNYYYAQDNFDKAQGELERQSKSWSVWGSSQKDQIIQSAEQNVMEAKQAIDRASEDLSEYGSEFLEIIRKDIEDAKTNSMNDLDETRNSALAKYYKTQDDLSKAAEEFEKTRGSWSAWGSLRKNEANEVAREKYDKAKIAVDKTSEALARFGTLLEFARMNMEDAKCIRNKTTSNSSASIYTETSKFDLQSGSIASSSSSVGTFNEDSDSLLYKIDNLQLNSTKLEIENEMMKHYLRKMLEGGEDKEGLIEEIKMFLRKG